MRLEVLDYTGLTGWRWRLTDPQGAFLADHQVVLDPTAWEFDAFTDLHRYLRWNASPDRRIAHESELVAQVGDWITTHALGPDLAAALARARAAVRLEVPAAAAGLGYRPWELARHGGRTLGGHRVSFVIDQQPHHRLAKNQVGERLRMLAVFSLPEGAGALNLRRERHALTRLVQQIAKVNSKAIDLRVLQYGATRRRLEQALLEQPGWDVIHLSGHGLAGGLVLEDDTGAHDVISSSELVDLLDYGSDQIKLVTLSACESAAVTAKEHLQQLGLVPADLAPSTRDADADAAVLPAVAAALVERLDCAVLAMRYPVVDDFAINLAGGFYDLLLGKNQPVTRALSLTLPRITTTASAGTPALSVGTPVLFGPRATTLTLTPPDGGVRLVDTAGEKLAGFPPVPERFVGRVGPLTRAATALAPGSGRSGVLFHGMAGGGKTACAVELAYNHAESFPLMAFHMAPPEGHDITPALTDFALALERQLPGLALTHLVVDITTLRAALPGLTRTMADNRVLVVLDNIESLLTPAGAWRDERWGLLVEALTAHQGLSRLVLTSRTRPAQLDPGVVVEAVHALSLRETVLLAREWPHLQALIDATPPPAGLSIDQARGLAARTLQTVQGHPKLVELADGVATHPDQLAARLDEADTTWLSTGTRLESFLTGGESEASDREFLTVLQGWTQAATTTLPSRSGLLFQLLCCLEEPDRVPAVVEAVWPQLWQQLHPTAHTDADPSALPPPAAAETVPDLGDTLAPLVRQALVAVDVDPDSGAVVGLRIHPGVADTGRTTTHPDTATAVDTITGDAWLATLGSALAQEHAQQTGTVVVRAARSAGPYLLRQQRWNDLDAAAHALLARDGSTAAAAAVLPLLATAADATQGTPDELPVGRTRAWALGRLDPAAGETLLRQLLSTAADRDEPVIARALTGDLIKLCGDTGRLDEALTLADTLPGYTRQAGLGPWSQLVDQGQRLQILRMQGRSREVLDAVQVMRGQWATLPDPPADNDQTAIPWNVREALLNLGCLAARGLGLWEQALELNAATLDSMRRRGASTSEQAFGAFNDSVPLLRLGRVVQARDLLHWCREVFEADNDIPGLGKTLSALADVEDALGHRDRSIALSADALRYTYLAGDPTAIATSHHNLATYLHDDHQDPRLVWAHRLAVALIEYQTGTAELASTLQAIAGLLASDPDTQPGTVEQVIAAVEQIDGVRLAALLDHLPHDRAPDNHTAFTQVLALADTARHEVAERTSRLVTGWDAVLAALHTARQHPDPDTRHAATTTVNQSLTVREQQPDWRDLAHALRRLLTGEFDPDRDDPDTLTSGLDGMNIAIVGRALDLLTGRDNHGINPDTWHTLTDQQNGENDQTAQNGFEAFLGAVVAAAAGDTTTRSERVDPVLDQMSSHPDRAALATALRDLIDHPDSAEPDRSAGSDPSVMDGLTPEQTTLLDTVRAAIAETRRTRPDPTPGPEQP